MAVLVSIDNGGTLTDACVTGVSMHALAAMQLCGEASGIQVRNPEVAMVFNMGGSAVANYASILERAA